MVNDDYFAHRRRPWADQAEEAAAQAAAKPTHLPPIEFMLEDGEVASLDDIRATIESVKGIAVTPGKDPARYRATTHSRTFHYYIGIKQPDRDEYDTPPGSERANRAAVLQRIAELREKYPERDPNVWALVILEETVEIVE